MSEHTKGEWEVQGRVIQSSESGRIPCEIEAIHPEFGPETEKERLANANLISAAPEMYEALRSLLNVLGGLSTYEIDHGYGVNTRNDILGDFGELGKDNINNALNVIAKAEGKS